MPNPVALMLAAPAIAKGISGLVNYANPVKYKRSGLEEDYVRELKRRSKEGIYSPGMQREMVSQTSRAASQMADVGKTQTQGNIVSQGLENSAVMNQATAGIDAERIRRVAEAARKISLQNQMSKIGAQDALGQYGMQQTAGRYQRALARRGNLTSAINATGEAVAAYGAEAPNWEKIDGEWVRKEDIETVYVTEGRNGKYYRVANGKIIAGPYNTPEEARG